MLQSEIASCEKKRGEYSQGIKELYLDKVKGIVTEEDFLILSKDFHDSRGSLDKLIDEKRVSLMLFESDASAALSKRQKIEKYTHITALTRDMVEELIDYISVGKKDPETGEREIEISWSF